MESIFAELERCAAQPLEYARQWKRENNREVVGLFPMNFPSELVHAAGALPVLIQEDSEQITLGRTLLHEYYCGYTRSVVDQAVTNKFEVFDALFAVDHCVALLGAVDAIWFQLQDKPEEQDKKKVFLAQYPASMDEPTTFEEVSVKNNKVKEQLETLCGVTLTAKALSRSIQLYNENRQLLREVYALRKAGRIKISPRQMQTLVKSSMVMHIEEHTEMLKKLVPLLEEAQSGSPDLVKLHLSGHMCHAPRPEIMELIEDCGAVIVDDDLFTGFRYISTDVPEAGDPFDALTDWYANRNVNVPCCTRAQKSVEWADYLVNSVKESGAHGVVTLMAKFCEPHMLYFPELRKGLERHKVPHLRLETEHEGIPYESIRTRVESFVEMIRRGF
ncbi:MAG: 2-hydroxyacyl-CoA dehydratase [Pseudomonadales bacterium]|nr:2-hydroxyacyl-CoA dehydratase [Pseudomonadales bacterium]